MDVNEFWSIVDEARRTAPAPEEPDGAEDVAERAAALLAARPAAEIVAAQQILWDLLSTSYRAPLWAAAYTINGGCSDDGFDYFRGWLVLQGREVFERAVADPDSLAESSVVRRASEEWTEVECESTLGIAWDAHREATGQELPPDSFRIRYPALDPSWDFDFDDWAETERRLPRLAALYARHRQA
ncbi:DUF4240 domain-containing protein [Streptomyces heilongjiangensis]|uniref:DUF4240 domain-containing protein n=1 Tax=Streptomyces heilongjiangensis TaxID=945052 RepID=A0ABW1B5J5_9ACTN|nr:DUF4240 domain-containing protein [Streptomyces heilongjiangensis]MDC2949181.1 DUF4240 domain-containing protein [Streptomyces heilongjiangensis]